MKNAINFKETHQKWNEWHEKIGRAGIRIINFFLFLPYLKIMYYKVVWTENSDLTRPSGLQ